ncbi:MAG: asparagine synthase (glutamine-hydrolyzing), partial [Anaerotignaceae bacterium]
MCGFCGFTGELIKSEEILDNMMNKIIHRGPDSEGKHIDEKVALGFRRLSIIDLGFGAQPMYNETDDVVITFNGEIYNYQELREELIEKGHI